MQGTPIGLADVLFAIVFGIALGALIAFSL